MAVISVSAMAAIADQLLLLMAATAVTAAIAIVHVDGCYCSYC